MNTTESSWTGRLAALDVEGRLRLLESRGRQDEEARRSLLLAALGDEDWRVRKTAGEALLELPPETKLLERLVGCIGAPENAGLRNAAAEILAAFGDRALPAVRGALASEDPDVRLFACNILGQIGNPASVGELIDAASDRDENVRGSAIENLGRFRLPAASEALIGFLSSGDLPTRFAALEALARQGARVPLESLMALLKQGILRKPVFDVLATGQYPEALEVLSEGLLDHGRSSRESALRAFCNTALSHGPELRERAIELIRTRLDEPALERIAKALHCDDQAVRRAAVRVLAASARPMVLDFLLGLGNDEGVHQALREGLSLLTPEAGRVLLERFDSLMPAEQAVAALAFGKMGLREALPLLHRCLRSDFGGLLRSAAEAIGELGDEQRVADLVGLLSHPYPDVREAATRALGSIGTDNPGAVRPHLEGPLASPSPITRAAAMSIIAQTAGDEAGLKQLELGLGDVDSLVRAEAAKALAAAHFAEATQPLARAMADEDPEVRRTVAYALGSYAGAEALEALHVGLHDPNLWVRCEAARSLGRMGGAGALGHLDGALAEAEVHPILAVRALEALEGADPERAGRRARDLLAHSDADVVVAALAALVRCGTASLSEPAKVLGPFLSHEHWNVRAHAATLLASLRDPAARDLLARRLEVERDKLVQKTLRDLLCSPEA